jgi:hypothetical protein
MKRLLTLAFGLFLTANVAAREMYGVSLPEQKTVAGKELVLNGAGLRTVFVLKIKIYVAAFYAPRPLKTAEEVSASEGPLRFDFTFLRAVGQAKVTEAWTAQLKDSVSYTYPGYEQDRDTFIKAYGPIKKFGVESVEIENDETRMYDDGVLKGTVKGKEFQKAFLSMWFGAKPVSPDLKAQLMGQSK